MKVFISWSGQTSRLIGAAFSAWLPEVMQFVQPFYTPNDIEKGQRWGQQIADNLQSSGVGLICITADNLLAPWLMFEAGAISKTEISRVCPILFGVEPSQLTGPLLQFQATPYNRDEVYKFAQTVNAAGGSTLSEEQLRRAFDRCWPELDEAIQKILAQPTTDKKPVQRTVNDMVEETLTLVRALASAPEEDELIHHWVLLFRGVCGLGRDVLKISKGNEQQAQLDQLRRTVEFMKFALNLIAPKISKAGKIKEISADGQAVLKAMETRIAELAAALGDDEIPF